jgi:hypothetical protein
MKLGGILFNTAFAFIYVPQPSKGRTTTPHHRTQPNRPSFAFGRDQPMLTAVPGPEGMNTCRGPVHQAISPVFTDDEQSFTKQNSKLSHRLTRSAYALHPSNPFRQKTQQAFLEIYIIYIYTPSRDLYRWQYSAGAVIY